MPSQVIVNGLIVGSAYGLLAASFTLICHPLRFLHVAHGAIYTLGAYSLLALLGVTWLPAPLSVAAAITAAIACGCGIYWFVYRPLILRNSSSAILLLASLGLLIVLQSSVGLIFGNATREFSWLDASPIVELAGARMTIVHVVTICGSTLLALALGLWLRSSRVGRNVRAIADDNELAKIVGIRVEEATLAAFAIGSALACVTSIFVALDTDLTPQMGFRAVIIAVVAAIFGGIGSVGGAFLAGIAIGMAQNVGAWFLPGQWQETVLYGFLVLILLVRPGGLFGVHQSRS